MRPRLALAPRLVLREKEELPAMARVDLLVAHGDSAQWTTKVFYGQTSVQRLLYVSVLSVVCPCCWGPEQKTGCADAQRRFSVPVPLLARRGVEGVARKGPRLTVRRRVSPPARSIESAVELCCVGARSAARN
jgi:hypothetical protein